MPIQVTYPGVYIEELPSGSKTISGVATAVTAFVGRALRGPTDLDGPVTIFGFDDYVGTFGGLHQDYPMGYAVQDFFLNGGAKAIIVRIYKDDDKIEGDGFARMVIDNLASAKNAGQKVVDAAEEELYNPSTASGKAEIDAIKAHAKKAADSIQGEPMATAAKAIMDAIDAVTDNAEAVVRAAKAAMKSIVAGAAIPPEEQLRFVAANPGSWGNFLNVSIDHDNLNEAMDGVYDGLGHKDLFNLEVSFAPAGGMAVSERHINLTIKDGYQGERRLDRVLDNESILLRAIRDDKGDPVWPKARPNPTIYSATGGAASAELDTLAYLGNEKRKTGIYALEKVDLFNLMCIPPDGRNPAKGTWDTPLDVYQAAAVYCQRKRAMLIIDPPKQWSDMARTGKVANINLSEVYNYADAGRNCAVYFPRVKRSNPLLKGAIEVFPACGMIAGVMSRTDVNRGVWKAPAGTEAGLVGARGLELPLTDNENGLLNPQGINCIRTFPVVGTVAWGGRTLRGADQLSDDYKYINVRRLTLYIEESLFRGTQFAVFEPNTSELWSTLKAAADSFMASLAKQGAFYSYEVVCDASTTTARDINLGRVNMLVAFAPVKPAEFVVIQIKQQALKE